MHNGVITPFINPFGVTQFRAVSDLELDLDQAPFNLHATATWYLQLIADRHEAAARRTSK